MMSLSLRISSLSPATTPFALLAALGLLAAPVAFAQGSLTPPGAPAPSMKSLDQIEPRVSISTLAGDATALFVITNPGAYYLTANISGASGKAAIAVDANDVSLDLNGFALIGVSGATRGVELRGNSLNFSLRNGSVRNWTTAGVGLAGSPAPTNAVLEDLRISAIAGPAISLAGGSAITIARCTVSGATQGILLGGAGLVERCVVSQITNPANYVTGIDAGAVLDCEVTSVTAGGSYDAIGINAHTARGCRVMAITGGGNGISVGIQSDTAVGCSVSTIGASNTGVGEGIEASTVSACTVSIVGNASSGSIQYGIAGTGAAVTGCSVSQIGNSSCSALVEGIDASVVSDCQVSQLYTKSSITGISAEVVSVCAVSYLNQLGASSGAVQGIKADVVTGCKVLTLGANSPTAAVGIYATRSVANSAISGTANNGAGGSIGLDLGTSCVANLCHVSGSPTTGIRATSNAKITQCEVVGSSITIGIDCQATSSLIDGNNVSGCVTGIKGTGSTLIVRNHVTSTTTKFSTAAACQLGPVSNATGTILSTVSPWANFTD